MLKIRLQRHGSKHSPFYRVVVAPSTVKRDGRFLEILGTYDPKNRKREAELKLNLERIDYWLGVGAQPSDTAKSLIRNGRLSAEDYTERMDKKSESKKAAREKKAKSGVVPSVDQSASESTEESGDEPQVAEKKSADEETEEGGESQAAEDESSEGNAEEPAAEEESADEETEEGGEPQATEEESSEEESSDEETEGETKEEGK